MSFSHPQGTHGSTGVSGGPVMRWFNTLVTRRARKSGGTVLGVQLLALTTIGRSSGQERTTPVVWFRADGGGWLVVASNGGATKNPGWYRNLAAHPDRAVVELDGERIPVTARELHGDERAAAWERITRAASQFAKYQRRTDREIPVVELTPRA
jgi:deazaflavin-dependent oxidoreductase (nitroreductase family)